MYCIVFINLNNNIVFDIFLEFYIIRSELINLSLKTIEDQFHCYNTSYVSIRCGTRYVYLFKMVFGTF